MQGAPCVVSVVQVMVFVGIEIKGTKQSQSLTAAQCDFSSFSNRMKEDKVEINLWFWYKFWFYLLVCHKKVNNGHDP